MTSVQREAQIEQRISTLNQELNYWRKVLKNAKGDTKTTAQREVNSIQYQLNSTKESLKNFRNSLDQR